jgi:hypothetical protein
MLEKVRPLHLLLFWLVLNLLQAGLTPLDPDEAYYWMYAGQLDWGYFDHPPLVALLINLGRGWLPGTLGLRFGAVLCSAATLGGLWLLVRSDAGPVRQSLFILWGLLLFAQPMLQLYGFIATPDGPLLLGTVLFFLAYRQYLARGSTAAALLWGGSMAFLLYAKYHGVLVIFFTVLSNWRLWRQPRFYLAGTFGALLFLPHLYWQFLHDFPSFRYHLSGRDDLYELEHTTGYFLNQFLIFNPLLWYHYWQTLRQGPTDRLERSFFWVLGGFWLFFFWSTFKGHTEAQWTAVLAIPLVVLLGRRLRQHPEWEPGLRRIGWISLGLFVALRLVLLLPPDYLPRALRKQFQHQPWVEELSRRTPPGQTLVLENSYRNAAIYSFYADRPAWTFTNFHYRPNQYDIWQDDTLLHNRSVLVAGHANWDCVACDSIRVYPKFFRYLPVDSFQVVKALQFELASSPPDTLHPGEVLTMRINYRSPYPYTIRTGAGNWPLRLFVVVRTGRDDWYYWPLEPQRDHELAPTAERLLPYGTYEFRTQYPAAAPTGAVELRLGLAYQGMAPLRGMSPVYTVWVIP